MEKLSRTRETMLLKALDKAADYTADGMGSNESIAKVAKECGLSLMETKRVVESYNKAKSVAFMKQASSEDRASEFELADYNQVVRMLGARIDKQASDVDDTTRIPIADFAEMAYLPPIDKRACASAPFVKHAGELPSEFSVVKEAGRMADFIQHTNNTLDDMHKRASCEAECLARDLAEAITLRVRGAELDKMACAIVDIYGEEKGNRFIGYMNGKLKGVKLPEGLSKKAHAVILPKSEVYDLLRKTASACRSRDLRRRDCEWFERSFLGIDKSAAAPSCPEDMSNSVGGVIQDLVSMPMPDTRNKSTVDPKTGLTPSMLSRKRVMDNMDAFYKMFMDNKEIQGYPLEDVYKAYNNVMSTTPELASKGGQWLSSSVLRQLAQGGKVDPFEVRDMLTAETTLHQGESLRHRAANDYVSATKNYHQRFDEPSKKG